MPGPKIAYQHFCPVARSLEVIGEKWSLLIVRDLLAGPRRFGDLRRSLAAITPKWLSLRLQDLEEAGIVQREAIGGREVWYQLTPKGRALAPVIADLVVWGVENAMRPPSPGQSVDAVRSTEMLVTYLNRRRVELPLPVAWVVRFDTEHAETLRFDGRRWSHEAGESEGAELVADMPLDAWASFLSSGLEERLRLVSEIEVEGAEEQVEAFVRVLGRQN